MTAIENGFDVANLLIHSALDELCVANRICQKINEIEPEKIEAPDCFFVSPNIESMDTSIKKHLIKSIVLFQSGMEAIIHWVQSQDSSISGKGSFAKKWINAFTAKDIDYDFSKYKNFYKNYRIHIVHPDRKERFETINNLIFIDIYNGLKCGWDAYAALSSAIGFKHDENSWEIMCGAHELPITSDNLDYCNPKELVILLNKKYRIHLNKVTS